MAVATPIFEFISLIHFQLKIPDHFKCTNRGVKNKSVVSLSQSLSLDHDTMLSLVKTKD